MLIVQVVRFGTVRVVIADKRMIGLKVFIENTLLILRSLPNVN